MTTLTFGIRKPSPEDESQLIDGIETYTEEELLAEGELCSREVMGCSFEEALKRVRNEELYGTLFSYELQELAFMLGL